MSTSVTDNQPVAGHYLDDELCVIGKSCDFRHVETGALVHIASFHGRSVWYINEDGTKNNMSMHLFWELYGADADEMSTFTSDPQPAYGDDLLCQHCGFLPVVMGENLCSYCRDRG